jgi:hypothetical protein
VTLLERTFLVVELALMLVLESLKALLEGCKGFILVDNSILL